MSCMKWKKIIELLISALPKKNFIFVLYMTWFMLNFDADVDKIVIELITECVDCLQVFNHAVVALSSPIYIIFSMRKIIPLL